MLENYYSISKNLSFSFLAFDMKSTILSKDLKMKLMSVNYPVDTGRELNVHKAFRRRPGSLLNVLCTFNLHTVSTGYQINIALNSLRLNTFGYSLRYRSSNTVFIGWCAKLIIASGIQWNFPDRFCSVLNLFFLAAIVWN